MIDRKARIIGIDPGLHTGVCVVDLYRCSPADALPQGFYTHKLIAGWALKPLENYTVDDDSPTISVFHQLMMVHGYQNLLIACEHFVFTRTSTMGGSRNAVEMTGALKAVRQIFAPRARLFTDQKPGDVSTAINDRVLTELGLKSRGDKQQDHARMAARHAVLLAFKIKTGKIRL